MTFSTEQYKKDFPFAATGIAYLDNASTTQKPQVVLDAMNEYYTEYAANVHRGIYGISERATAAYEGVRDQVRQLINAQSREEIIFTSGTTHALNLAARLVAQNLSAGDEIIVTRLEHHANLIPWQLIAKEHGFMLKFFELNEQDELSPAAFEALITPRTKVLALTHVSNVSGYATPAQELIRIAHAHGVLVVIDAAQSVPHLPVDVQALDVDFLAFSAHKMCGPTGVGVLYGKRSHLEQAEPVFGGGSMITDVELAASTWADLPLKFEPGTPPIAEVIGFGAAITYLQSIGFEQIHQTITELESVALEQLRAITGLHIFGSQECALRNGIISFTINGIHPHDAASILDDTGVCVRAGHHCAQPLLKYWNVPATIRASFSFYNTREDIDRLVTGITHAIKIFS